MSIGPADPFEHAELLRQRAETLHSEGQAHGWPPGAEKASEQADWNLAEFLHNNAGKMIQAYDDQRRSVPSDVAPAVADHLQSQDDLFARLRPNHAATVEAHEEVKRLTRNNDPNARAAGERFRDAFVHETVELVDNSKARYDAHRDVSMRADIAQRSQQMVTPTNVTQPQPAQALTGGNTVAKPPIAAQDQAARLANRQTTAQQRVSELERQHFDMVRQGEARQAERNAAPNQQEFAPTGERQPSPEQQATGDRITDERLVALGADVEQTREEAREASVARVEHMLDNFEELKTQDMDSAMSKDHAFYAQAAAHYDRSTVLDHDAEVSHQRFKDFEKQHDITNREDVQALPQNLQDEWKTLNDDRDAAHQDYVHSAIEGEEHQRGSLHIVR